MDKASKEAWTSFLDEFKGKYYKFRQIVVLLAELDCLVSFAKKAIKSNFVKPTIVECKPDSSGEEDQMEVEAAGGTEKKKSQRGNSKIVIKGGRHPILDNILSNFVPNDTYLDNQQKCMVVTGPNMGGKSCYIKQVALIVLLSQIGSFVPAEKAIITPVDCILVRMGAQDCLDQNKSTFFVEMQETSDIIRKVTSSSLVIIDELGRGTSTHDGVAIADATLRYFINNIRCFCLFVTHYHLLCQTAIQFPLAAANYHMGFIENSSLMDEGETDGTDEESITFLYQIQKGMASKSYGLNVARLAGIPGSVIQSAMAKSQQLQSTMRLVDSSGATSSRDIIISLLKDLDANKRSELDTFNLIEHIWDTLKSIQ